MRLFCLIFTLVLTCSAFAQLGTSSGVGSVVSGGGGGGSSLWQSAANVLGPIAGTDIVTVDELDFTSPNILIGDDTYAITSGTDNVLIGENAGVSLTTHSGNVFIGNDAGENATASNTLMIDNSNTATPLIYGDFATDKVTVNDTLEVSYLSYPTSNVIIGGDTYAAITGTQNTLVGNSVGASLTSAKWSTCLGSQSCGSLTGGNGNTAIGYNSQSTNGAGGTFNTSLGYASLSACTGCSNTVAIGTSTAGAATNSDDSVYIGRLAGGSAGVGSTNVMIGAFSGQTGAGSGNVFLGANSGKSETGSNLLYITNADDSSPLVHGNFSTDFITINGSMKVTEVFALNTPSEVTIATDALTVTESYHTVDTESDGATDDLTTINGGAAGDILILSAEDGARTVVLKDGTGNLSLAGDMSLDNAEDTITLIYNGSGWLELTRSDNGA